MPAQPGDYDTTGQEGPAGQARLVWQYLVLVVPLLMVGAATGHYAYHVRDGLCEGAGFAGRPLDGGLSGVVGLVPGCLRPLMGGLLHVIFFPPPLHCPTYSTLVAGTLNRDGWGDRPATATRGYVAPSTGMAGAAHQPP